jgi:catechol 2,3-dioxygenase-like lactoylglutathione lyase family enzyme
MDNLSARTVFFVKDAESALRFYTEKLGFALDWNHKEQDRAFVFQVSLLGFQLILNQAESWTDGRAGHGRAFIGMDDDQTDAFRQHVERYRIPTETFHWGAPTLVIRDLDENEIFISVPEAKRAGLIDTTPTRKQ